MVMKDKSKRDNSYWLGRLEKDGHTDLLAQVEENKISVYKAAQEAGYRPKAAKPPAAKLSYHWGRADHSERKRFVLAHLKDVNRVLREVGDDINKMKAQKVSE